MVRYSIDNIKDDMILGEAVMLPTGKMLLNAGYKVNEQYRNRLKSMGIRSLLIQTPGTETVMPTSVVSEKSVNELGGTMKESEERLNSILDKFHEDSTKNIHKMIFEKRKDLNGFIMNPVIAKQINVIIEEIFNEPEIVLNMAALNQSNTSFFNHAINVAITALCIGRKHNFTYDEIKQLGIGALHYHVGLLALPKELLNKTGEFTEDEKKEYRQHTVYGYLMLSQNYHIPATSAIVALQHHEMQNGSGYPMGIKGNNRPPLKDISQTHVIHRFAEIVSVADAYHRVLKDQSFDEFPSVQKTIEKMIKLSGVFINKEIVKTLVSIIPAYPIGTRIRITDAPSPQLKKYIGVVSADNPHDLSRPKILLYETTNHKKIHPPIVIDTSKATGVSFEILV